MPLLEYTGNAVLSSLVSGLTPTASTMTLSAASGWPLGVSANWTATIDQGGPNEEKVLCSTRTGTTVNIIQRGYDDTSARAHDPGESVKHTISAAAMEEGSLHVWNTGRDDHTQYLNAARHVPHGTALIEDLAITTAKIADAAITAGKLGTDSVITAKVLDGNITLAKLAAAVQLLLLPTGAIFPYVADVAPSGFLLGDGSAVSRTTYAALFALCGTKFGVGDGVTTFNLPDIRKRMVLGQAASGAEATIGATGGTFDHVHDLDSATSHARIYGQGTELVMQRKTPVTGWTSNVKLDNVDVQASGSLVTLGSALGGDSDPANPPYIVLNHIIKV